MVEYIYGGEYTLIFYTVAPHQKDLRILIGHHSFISGSITLKFEHHNLGHIE